MNKKKFIKNLLKFLVFVVIFAVLLVNVTTLLIIGSDRMSYQSMHSLYEEKDNSLDAVYIGSSNVLAFWNPMLAWEEYGINVSTFASNSQPFITAQFSIEEVRKSQPDAMIIVNINTLAESTTVPRLHKIFSSTPLSWNKITSVQRVGDWYDLTFQDKLELCLPIIRFHDRWSNLVPADFEFKTNGYRGAIASQKYLGVYNDVSNGYNLSNGITPLPELLETATTSLLDYCDEREDLKILFVTVPQAKDVETLGKYNAINAKIKERGYDVLNLMDNVEDIRMFTEKDYYNDDHINIHGSAKYTYYISEYLIKNYGFKDKRGNEEYRSWDENLTKYLDVVDSSILDFELDTNYDPYSLDAPENLTAVAQPGKIDISWSPVEGADGYAVYKKHKEKGQWCAVYETTDLSFTDTDFIEKHEYFYRAVPFTQKDGKKSYGDFSYKGASVIAKTPSK